MRCALIASEAEAGDELDSLQRLTLSKVGDPLTGDASDEAGSAGGLSGPGDPSGGL